MIENTQCQTSVLNFPLRNVKILAQYTKRRSQLRWHSKRSTLAYCRRSTRVDWTGLDWTGFVKHGCVKGGFVTQGCINGGFLKNGFVIGGLVKHGCINGGFVKHKAGFHKQEHKQPKAREDDKT